MDINILQTIRYKIQKRLKRINTADYQFYHDVIVQSWGFLTSNPVIVGILDDLEQRVPTAKEDSQSILSGKLMTGETEIEHIALCYWLIKRCVTSKNPGIEISLGHSFHHAPKHAEAVEFFTQSFVEPLFDYIDEQIDDQRTILSLLRKYKHRTEWFFRDELRSRFERDTLRGERRLAMDLYAYLHDQGLDFSIEPSSISGKADLISAQTGSDRLVADVKIFDPTRSKGLSYLHAGFHQVYQYTKDHNDPFGYMVVFKTCAEDLSINAPNQESSVPFFIHNNKTLFVLVIDIFDHPTSASKRGALKSYELLECDLIKIFSNDLQSDTDQVGAS